MSGYIGNSTFLAADYGCLIASMAMMATDMGHRITPDDLNAQLTARNIYENGADTPDDAICRVLPGIKYIGRFAYPAALTLAPGEQAILCLNGIVYGLGYDTHFVRPVWYDGSTVGWEDPWGGIYKTYAVADASKYMHDARPVLKYRAVTRNPWWFGG